MIDVALSLAAAGWRVFPCDLEKVPLVAWGTEATTDANTIRYWFAQWPQAMPAIALSRDWAVVDIDPRNGGDESIAALPAGALPPTTVVRTPSGGEHWYYRVPTGVVLKNRNGWRPGVDVKTAGGMVIAPGAVRADGKSYAVVDAAVPPADLPPWVLLELERGAETDRAGGVSGTVSRETEASMGPALASMLALRLADASKGGRHVSAMAIGGALARAGWSDEGIHAVASALPSAKPGGRGQDALDTARKARAGEAAFGWPELERVGHAPAVLNAARTMASGGVWDALAASAEASATAALAGTQTAAPTAAPTADSWQEWGGSEELDDVAAPLVPIPFLVEGLRIAPDAPTIIAGKGGLGKSMFVQLLMICVATGRSFLGMPVRQGRVVHLDYEQGKRLTRRRYQRLAAGLGIRGKLPNLKWVSSPRANLVTPGVEAALVAQLTGVALCVIDSLKASTPGVKENDAEARVPLDMLGRVSDATGCTIIVLHHARKTPKDAPTDESMRGSTAIRDAAGLVIMLEPADHGFDVVAEKVRDGVKFPTAGVSVSDEHVEGYPFEALVLSSIAADLRRAEREKEERAETETRLVAYVAQCPAGIFAGSQTDLERMHGEIGAGRNETRAAMRRLLATGALREDKNNGRKQIMVRTKEIAT